MSELRFLDLRALCIIMSFTLSYHEHLWLYQWVWQSVLSSTLMLNLFHLGLLTSELSAGLKAEFLSILFNSYLIFLPQFFVPLLDWCDDQGKRTSSPFKYVLENKRLILMVISYTRIRSVKKIDVKGQVETVLKRDKCHLQR